LAINHNILRVIYRTVDFNWQSVALVPRRKYPEYSRSASPSSVCELKRFQFRPWPSCMGQGAGLCPQTSVISSCYALAMSLAVPLFISFWRLCWQYLWTACSTNPKDHLWQTRPDLQYFLW